MLNHLENWPINYPYILIKILNIKLTINKSNEIRVIIIEDLINLFFLLPAPIIPVITETIDKIIINIPAAINNFPALLFPR